MTSQQQAPRFWKPASIREASGRVYHYGSARTLLGVVEDGVLWASETAGLNDVAEIRGGWDFIENWLDAQPCAEASWHADGEWEWNEDFDWSGPAVLLLRSLIPGAELASKERRQAVARTATQTFVLCASTRDDDANQWRLYGGEGRGYAIGLDASVPLAVLGDEALVPESPHLASVDAFFSAVQVTPWLHVLYTNDQREKALRELVKHVADEIKNSAQRTDVVSEEEEEMGATLEQDASTHLETIAWLIKSPGFQGENEVRVVVTAYSPENHLHFRESPVGIVRYYQLVGVQDRTWGVAWRQLVSPDLGRLTAGKPPVTDVCMGPLLPTSNEETVRALLRRHGLPDEVRGSGVPLR
ncbi:DUF2971 domain-containing protein [Promicromonospora sp. NPDC057488]|uniref:DUF2971 domain-containing protein n=1 Tax=Promicromonospora sp. NPDC057488 TaxID=3346147 RepID=UPI0036728706